MDSEFQLVNSYVIEVEGPPIIDGKDSTVGHFEEQFSLMRAIVVGLTTQKSGELSQTVDYRLSNKSPHPFFVILRMRSVFRYRGVIH